MVDKHIFIWYNNYANNIASQKSSRFLNSLLNCKSYKLSLNFMTGIIKALTDKGFGFIAVDGQEKDLFFHSKSLVGVQFNE